VKFELRARACARYGILADRDRLPAIDT